VGEARYREAERVLWASFSVEPRERWIDLAHTGTAVRVQEVGEGPPVLFVHGATNAGTSWVPLVAHLPDFRCLLLDRPGCGLSVPLPFDLEDPDRRDAFADRLVAEVLDGLGLVRAHVVGTSFGGYLVLRGAAARPERVDHLVIQGWTIGAPMARTPLAMRLAVVPGLNRLLTAVPPTRGSVRALFRQIGLRQALASGAISDEAIDWFLALLRDTDTLRNEIDSAPGTVRPLRGAGTALLLDDALLARVTAPTGFLWGSEDPFGGRATAEAFTTRLPNAELEVLEGAGHAPWMDDATHAAAVTRRYLEG
jgi:pimeloyl-ACP methyl ester carboxylesterase